VSEPDSEGPPRVAGTPAGTLGDVFSRVPGPDGPPALALRDVSVHFGGIAAVQAVDLDVAPTELVAVVGPNGAGKSTMLNAISGLVRSSGEITVSGGRVDGLPAAVRAAAIGRSFQDAPLIEQYTVLENVLCGAHTVLRYRLADQLLRRRHVRRREGEYERRARILLDFVGLSAEADTEAGELSYGAMKRADIARAMITGPRLLLLDEPSSGLDAHERDALRGILGVLRAEQLVATVFVEHHMDLVRATADRVVVLKAGEVLMTGPPDAVLDSPEFTAAVLGHRTGESGATAPVPGTDSATSAPRGGGVVGRLGGFARRVS
jgi:branched-chain amino acid transport system ATP-binding protein